MRSNFVFHRDPNRGWVAGICAGFAEHFQISVLVVRILFFGLLLFSGIFPAVIAYFILAIIIPSKANENFRQEPGQAWQQQGQQSNQSNSLPRDEPAYLEERLQRLSSRIERLESYLVSDAYQVDREFQKLRELEA